MNLSKSAGNIGRNLGSGPTNSTALVVASLPTATISSLVPSLGTSAPGSMQPQTVQEFQRMLEETKKEVREIRAIEAQMRWNLAREESRERAQEEEAVITDIRDWRWRQSEEMK